MNKKRLSLALRIVIGVALIGVMVQWIGLDALSGTWQSFSPIFYALAVTLLFAHFAVQSLVLRILLTAKDVTVRARHIFRLMVICQFFGVFLPGGVGPDLVLCYNMVRSTAKKELALSAIIFIRITVLFVMALFAFFASFHPIAAQPQYQLLTAGILLAFCAYFFLMANRHSLALARKVLEILNRHKVTAILYKTYFALAAHGQDRATALRIAPFLLLSAMIKVMTDYVVALSLGFDIPFIYFLVVVPLVTVISALPLTFAGLGIREGAFIGLFTLVGVPAEEALAISLVSFSLMLVTAGIGAILYGLYGTQIITETKSPYVESSAAPKTP